VTYEGMFYNGVFGSNADGIVMLFIMLLIVWFAPNTVDLLRKDRPVLGINAFVPKNKKIMLKWKYNITFASILAFISLLCVLNMAKPSEFLYFQF
jgi:hypothetical protein